MSKLSQFDQLDFYNLCVYANGKMQSIDLEFLSDRTNELISIGRVGPTEEDQLGKCQQKGFEDGSSIAKARLYRDGKQITGIVFGVLNGFVIQRLG